MNHFIMLYELDSGDTMRQSFWCNHDDERRAKWDWERRTGRQCVGVAPPTDDPKQGERHYHILYEDKETDTILAKDPAGAISKAFDKRKVNIVICELSSVSTDMTGTSNVSYEPPKLQQKSVKHRKPSKAKAAKDTATFGFLEDVDRECSGKTYNEE